MRIYCSRCGASVSSEVPDNTIIRAWVECPECIEKERDNEQENNKFSETSEKKI